MTIWGYIILKDSSVFPTWLGGTGSLKNCFKDYPFAPQFPNFLIYSLVQMGYYFEETVDHNFFRPKSSDYWEMNLHHLLTICLFGGMITMNGVSSGTFCCFIHCIADIFTASSRILSHTIYKKATVVSFGSCILVWIFTRNIVIPVLCYECWSGYSYPASLKQFDIANTILVSFLTILCFLHLYWTGLFINMIKKAVKSGDTENTQSKSITSEKINDTHIKIN